MLSIKIPHDDRATDRRETNNGWYVPRLAPKMDVAKLGDQLFGAIRRVIDSGIYIGGPEVSLLEDEISAMSGGLHAIAVGSGTDAITISLMAAVRDMAAGDTVITSPLTFTATASSILRAGLRPVFADIDETTFCLDLASVDASIDSRVRALLPVDLYGRIADIEGLRTVAPDLPIIEDGCQAFGARDSRGTGVGLCSDICAFSFFPSKPLGGFGDGGLILTRHSHLASEARLISHHGSSTPYIATREGFNSRLDAIQAALLRVKLSYVEECRLLRERCARKYIEALRELEECRQTIKLPAFTDGHAWHCFTVLQVEGNRDFTIQKLRDRGVEAVAQYPVPLHRMAPFTTGQHLPVAERITAQLFCLPIWAGISDSQIDFVASRLREIL